ncbi:SDR family NAD(P)-dependent oxidoreductase [Alteraurantiacibacter palmitatis]|uniref:SDR family NAD(P)-dependent oxidoreductase n=1 Tax=Alteraurantiacibacter palmitatis TaxID=2054628 RepID=A0ABV7E456_9SPHN
MGLSKPVTGTWPASAAVFGASGGIGAAFTRVLADRAVPVSAGSRGGDVPRHHLVAPFTFDLTDESSIAAAAARMADNPPELVLVASGALTLDDGTPPEKSYKAMDAAAMARALAVNTIGPALIAKHILPLMPRDRRFVFAVLSARVGSISDNRLGGWHSYRASKAALNMLVKNWAIELGRTHKLGAIVALHPGTVETRLSAPFQQGLPPGQLRMRRDAAQALVDVVMQVGPDQSGMLIGWDGEVIAP